MFLGKRLGHPVDQEHTKRPRLLFPDNDDQPFAAAGYLPCPEHTYQSAKLKSQRYHPLTPLSFGDASPGQPGTPASFPVSTRDSVYCCFGTLCEVKARMLKDPAALEESCFASSSGYIQLQVVYKRNYLLQDSNGLDLAVLNQRTGDALRILDSLGVSCYEAYVTAEEWIVGTNNAKGNAGTTVVDVEINVNGPFDTADEVGRILSKAELFLQRPSMLAPGTAYHNPHIIDFPDIQDSAFPSTILTAPGLDTPSTLKLNIQDVLGCLDQNGYLMPTAVDERIILTKLHKHQKEAVDFIAQREAKKTPPAFSLWKPHQTRTNQYCYRHVVLDIKKQHPPKENFGGVIADEMGLGKTLSMLAAISFSSDTARSFANGLTVKPTKRKLMATLVIVPSALILQNWASEIDRHCAPGTMRYLKYHGNRRQRNVEAVLDKEVVLTTYETVSTDFVRGESILYKVAWFRIVLDEAHYICGQQTNRFCSASALQAQHRWCLTGTPIQNRLDDLAALVRFLKVSYLDNAFSFSNHISKPIEHNQSHGLEKLRSLLKSICIRRTKSLITVPDPTICVRRLNFTNAERQAYIDVATSHRREMDEGVSGRSQKDSQIGLCQAILRLRRFCNNGDSVFGVYSRTPSENPEDKFAYLQEAGEAACVCCHKAGNTFSDPEEAGSGCFGACSHFLCYDCINRDDCATAGFHCPICRIWSDPSNVEPVRIAQRLLPQPSSFNTKAKALYHDIASYQGSEKGIVFTTWRETISVISSLLTTTNIGHRIVDGTMSITDRKTSLEQFQSDPTCTILLMTFGTGSAGLNLTAASYIHIVEPQWNPSVESQAIGRAVRIGQQKSVTVFRYIINNTVEEYMENIQARKAELANMGWDADGKLKLIAKRVFNLKTTSDCTG